ncbi:MAG: bifunctional UDP-N-acetylglucosamine diphosphorylase/glucosamine-1-phosphate N-acetyltransferase GlmU [bacterium]
MHDNLAVVVLAGGLSTRFKSDTPKLLHKLAGKPILGWVLDAARVLNPLQIIVVYGPHNEFLKEHFQGVDWALQEHPRGTADALLSSKSVLDPRVKEILLISGDTPFIRPETLLDAVEMFEGVAKDVKAVVLAAIIGDPTGYGRIVRSGNRVDRIIEEKDAKPSERENREVNSGIYVLALNGIWSELSGVSTENAKGEMYLTDVISTRKALICPVQDSWEIAGINTRADLAAAEAEAQRRIISRHLLDGVSFIRPETCYVEAAVTIAPDTVIMPGTCLLGNTTIGAGCKIGPDSYIDRSSIGDGCEILKSTVNRASVGNRVKIGPFCNVRPETVLEDDVKLGDFVEIKKARVGRGSKIPHLSYVGDAVIGERVNIGAGTITCNYDGVNKHQTTIEDDVFVGSNSTIIAPRIIRKGGYVAAGSVITEDVPPDDLAVGRGRQVNKSGYARRLRESMARSREKAAKAGAIPDSGEKGEEADGS